LSDRAHVKKDLVSIITPVYNSEKYIGETIESVLAQTYSNWEMLIVDNGSTDHSLDIIYQYAAKDARIKVFQQTKKNGFPSYTRNMAIEEAQGKYIAFLDSDDVWYPEKIAIQLAYISDHPDCHIICTSYEKVNKEGVSDNRVVKPRMITNYIQLLKTNSIGNLTGMYNQEKLGKCFQKPIFHEDYLMWLTLLKKGEVAHGIDEVTAKYRIHNRSVSSSKLKVIRAQWYIYRQELNLNFFYATYFFTCYTYYGIKKHLI
jgi:glycosyltransferase involved in cell wall biosynthesis